MVSHRDREDEDARPFGIEHPEHMMGELRVGIIGGPPRTAEGLDAQERFEAQRRKRQISPKKAAVERVQADGAIALPAQVPDERGDRRARKGVVWIEPVVSELALRDSGQYRELSAHRVGTPARDVGPTEGPANSATGVEARRQSLRVQPR